MNAQYPKQFRIKLVKELIEIIILHLLDKEPMHGYQIISHIRKSFDIYLGPSSVYPILKTLEEKGSIKSEWINGSKRPRKVYNLTVEGQTTLKLTRSSLIKIRDVLLQKA
jgi:DNA-binding PadR family transcriptional regulator